MSTPLLILIACTLAGIAAVALLTSADAPRHHPSPSQAGRHLLAPLGAGLVTAVVVLAVSGWLLPSVVVGVVGASATDAWRRREQQRDDAEYTDAIAAWIENLRDVLVAGEQPIGAITATVPTCHPSIQPAVRRLAAALGRHDPELALSRFADDLDDPLGDLVAAGLLVAVQRGARTVPVLTALAEQARQQADRRRLVEAEHAPVRREVRLLGVLMAGLVAAVLLLGRAEYLEPYGTADGQVVLATILAAYAALLLRVQRLARLPRPARFLSAARAAGSTQGSAT